MADTVTVRELRNNGAMVLARVSQGERLRVTKDGQPVAEVVPLPRLPLNAEELVRRFKSLPSIDGARMRRDIDEVLDPSL